jgi:hypothetical protein
MPPAAIALTKQQKQLLKYVQTNPGCSAWEAAQAIGCRPHYALAGLDALAHFRHIHGTPYVPGESDYTARKWSVLEETK